jgi:tRNA:m4X modification enzyme
MSSQSTEDNEKKTSQPQLPDNWDRCHAYNDRKRRYCRQMPAPNQIYCGNHLHLVEEDCDRKRSCDDVESFDAVKTSNKKKRIPCPIDPSHLIFESALAKHVLVCPAAKEREETCSREYYLEGTNTGGFGDLGDDDENNDVGGEGITDLDRAKQLAMSVLRVFSSVFPSSVARVKTQNKGHSSHDDLSDDDLKYITEDDIYNALPEFDLSSAEEGIAKDIAKHQIKTGGPRHLHQLQSILGHARQNGLIAAVDDEREGENVVIEMGAGRGMLGLVIASAIGAAQTKDSSSNVKLYLVERSGTRGKAETKIRTAAGDTLKNNDDCLRLDRVEVSRIKCDLAHVHTSAALPFLTKKSEKSRSIVVAKHLCGAGTDLALKSLRDVSVYGCVMATCCHGLCTWKDYVGRDCFLELFRGVGGLSTLFERDFDQLKRWTSASVLEDSGNANASATTTDVAVTDAHNNGDTDNVKGKSQNIFLVVNELGLACGGKGLGRACQRLIDYGRIEYIKRHLFHTTATSSAEHDCIAAKVSLCHYCSSDVTPQNALIIAKRG